MDGESNLTKLTLAKIPIALICLALLFIDFSSGDGEEPEFSGVVTRYVLAGLHSLVFLDLFWRNPSFSKVYYTFLTLVMAWMFIPDKATLESKFLAQSGVYLGNLLWLLPYFFVTWLAWRNPNSSTLTIKR